MSAYRPAVVHFADDPDKEFWGVASPVPLDLPQTVTVTSKKGKAWPETLTRRAKPSTPPKQFMYHYTSDDPRPWTKAKPLPKDTVEPEPTVADLQKRVNQMAAWARNMEKRVRKLEGALP